MRHVEALMCLERVLVEDLGVTIPLPEALVPVVDLLRRVYPQGVPALDYGPLLVVLSGHLSERNLGLVIWGAMGEEPVIAQNDAAAALSVKRPAPADVLRVRGVLEASDFDGILDGD